ncbi:MAG: DNA repair protein RadC [Clostridia bacterium]|nr:DNA repair protein RadC [Clostridia bacterium]
MHDGHRERMRERYLKYGIDSFAPHEILEILLYYVKKRENTNPLAHDLINAFGSLSGVIDADAKDLLNTDGVGEQTVVLIKLIKDIFEYYQKEKWGDIIRLNNVDEIGYYIQDMIGDKPYESLYLLCLDNANKILAFQEIERGSVSSAATNPRKIIETAVRNHAEKAVLAHNHPSGIITPSQEDLIFTHQMRESFKAIKINMIDHIITGGNGFTSMAREGYI